MTVAQTILDQIRAGTDARGESNGRTLLMCWGAREFIAHGENDEYLGGLRFRVSGAKFKGFVFVKLETNDTYTVQFAKIRKHEWQVKREEVLVYCDQLTALIDSEVER